MTPRDAPIPAIPESVSSNDKERQREQPGEAFETFKDDGQMKRHFQIALPIRVLSQPPRPDSRQSKGGGLGMIPDDSVPRRAQ